MNWFGKIFTKLRASDSSEPPPDSQEIQAPVEGGQAYLEKVHRKVDKVVSDFAKGLINRSQFQELYSHYQQEIAQVEETLLTRPEDWKSASTEGSTILIRRHHIARAQAYAIYLNESGIPLATLGKFTLDPALVVPMLSSYSSATKEIFGASLRLSQVGEDHWMCFITGEYTTMLTVFTNEPVAMQLNYLSNLHRDFEIINHALLAATQIDIDRLIFPHEYFLGRWQR